MLRKLRYLLLPLSLLYGLVVWLRNQAYDWGLFRSRSFDFPLIVIGNLAVGGVGKSPMTEYLIRLLGPHMRVATLSRGYGRKTRGFRYVKQEDEPQAVGDEPLQFKRKYPNITVAVCENRVLGVERLQSEHDIVLLDDAYQHRKLKAGFNLLLFDYHSLLGTPLLLPAGDFRDTFNQRNRADMIIISKSPESLTSSERLNIMKRLNVSSNLPVLFTYLRYGIPYPLGTTESDEGKVNQYLEPNQTIIILTGIANPSPLLYYVRSKVKQAQLLSFPDHHQFTEADIQKLKNQFNALPEGNKLILTTEKDAQRLKTEELLGHIQALPIHVLPIEITFQQGDEERFRKQLFSYLTAYHKRLSLTLT